MYEVNTIFPIPATQVTGVPLTYYDGTTWLQEPPSQSPPPYAPPQAAARTETIRIQDPTAEIASALTGPSGPVSLPFSYAARCATYCVILCLSLLAGCFAIVMLCSKTFMTVTQYRVDYTWTYEYLIPTFTNIYFSSDGKDFEYDLESALTRGMILPGPPGVRVAGQVTVAAVVGCGVLVLFAAVVLCVNSCHRGSARNLVALEEHYARKQQAEREMDEQLHQHLSAMAPGVIVYVLNEDRGAASRAAQREKLQRSRPKLLAYQARVRMALSIVCMVLSVLLLVLTIVALASGLVTASTVRRIAAKVQAEHPDLVGSTWCSAALKSASVWALIPNLILLVATTVLLGVPHLSGIADRPAATTTEDNEHRPREEETAAVAAAGGGGAGGAGAAAAEMVPREGEEEEEMGSQTYVTLHSPVEYADMDGEWSEDEDQLGNFEVVAKGKPTGAK